MRRVRVWTFMAFVAAVVVTVALPRIVYGPPFPPGSVLRQVPARMKGLRPGMTERQVWSELGLSWYRANPGAGNGPSADYLTAYDLGSGYSLQLRFDMTRNPPGFTHASFGHGRRWVSTP